MKHKILFNISVNFAVRIITYVFSFLNLIYITRVLQPEIFGRVSFAANYVGYFVLLANLGMQDYAVRACAQVRDDPRELRRTFNELWSISVILSIVSAAGFAVTVVLVPKLSENWMYLAIYGTSILLQMIGCEWLYKGLEKYSFLALSSVACKSIPLICIVLFVRSEKNLLLYAALSVLVAYGNKLVCFAERDRYVGKSLHFGINRKHIRPLLIFFMMSCAVSIYSNLDLTMLGFTKSEYETGLYSIASKGKHVLTMTGVLVYGTILPLATKLWKSGERARFEKLASKTLVSVTAFQSLVAIVCILFARQILILVGGKSYVGATASFRILLLSLPPIAASNILGGQVLIPGGKEKRLLTAEIAGAVFNFFANLIVIPRYSIAGAASTTVISEVIVLLICAYYCKKELGIAFGKDMVKSILQKS